MKRWCFYDDGGREEDPNGEWVRYEDAKTALEVLRGAGKVLIEENQRLCAALQRALDAYETHECPSSELD